MAQAPTGIVTLVFTDIQGSTVLWEHFGDDFKAFLDLHNRLFRAAIDEFGGYEVQTIGDAFMVAFQDAGSAVAMCQAMQERLHAAEWPGALNDERVTELAGATEDGTFRGIRVRMGVHTGKPDCQVDPVNGRMNYFGSMVNRAARVCDVGHGGQLVVSEATWEAVGNDGLPEGTLVEDLGDHALKGLEQREHLRQLLPGALSGRTFPRLKTPNLKKTNLPTRLDSFFGREPEIAELTRRIAGGQRLITVLGAGGTGKTRLAQRLGGTQLGDFPGGVWFCDLTEARSRSGILSAMGAALEVPLTSRDPELQLADAILGRGRVAIILDNFEQVVDQAADTVGRWLQRAPEAVFLVTSRALLRIAGEEVFILDPLPVAEAVSLFYDRAGAAQPGFGRTRDNEAVVTKIVERLDCMSLAVELAAARVRMLPPEQILSRLSERFKLLRGQRRDHTARQATLRGAIDWSWELLKPPEQTALSQLSVFRGGSTLKAAEAVVDLGGFDDEPWVLDVVGALVDHSLLRRIEPHPGHVRYRMLESIREYAAEKLGDAAVVTALRHSSHFASLGDEAYIEALDTHDSVERRKALPLELENLLAGAEGGLAAEEPEVGAACALAAGHLFELHGPSADGITVLERFTGQPVCRNTQARLLQKSGRLLELAGRTTEAGEHLRQALAIAREVGDRRLEGIALGNLAILHLDQSHIPEALEHFQQALEVHREAGNRGLEGIILGTLANLHHSQGHIQEALEGYQQALASHREVGSRRHEGISLGNIAILDSDQGRISEALEHFQQALAIHREMGNRRDEGNNLGNIANLHFQQGRLPEALEHYRQTLLIHREVGNRRFEGVTLGNLGELLLVQGDHEAAEAHLQQAITICDEVFSVGAGAFRGSLGLLRAHQGAFEEARLLLARAEPQVRGIRQHELGKLLCKKAQVEHLAGDPTAANSALAEAEAIVAALGAGPDSDLTQAVAESRNALAR